MTFYSTEEFLAAEARKARLEMRGKTSPLPPGVVHPPDQERRAVQHMLDSIPEVRPGPNAFALRATESERQRAGSRMGSLRGRELQDQRTGLPQDDTKEMREDKGATAPGSLRNQLASHPQYQAELHRRRVTPPTQPHPALRQQADPDQPRDSACTNITDFMQAGKAESPKLKLGATPNPSSVPTFRARVEDRNEQSEFEKSGSDIERVPVFHPTPKVQATKVFAQRPGTPVDALQKEEHASKLPVKTPKKSLMSKLKLSTNSRSRNAVAASDLLADPADEVEEHMPVKAQAFLGETYKKHKHRASLGSPPIKMLARSPSKRNYFFSRKNADSAQTSQPSSATLHQNQRPLISPSSTRYDLPQTAISDPTHFSYQENRGWSKSQSGSASDKEAVQTAPMVARSQSINLRYIDNRAPPTPPAKNTPPHEVGAKQVQDRIKAPNQERQRLLEDHEGIVAHNDRLSPTKFGNYGYRDAPRLVTQPSKYSLHASVVPDMMEATTIEEMEARVGGLDLEGINSPTDNMIRRANLQEALYSPSNYSSGFASPGVTPMLRGETSRLSNADSCHTKDSSSNGTIQIVYPELTSDPSYRKNAGLPPPDKAATAESSEQCGRPKHLSPELTWHGRTHSRDHLDNDNQSIFAQHVDNGNARGDSPERRVGLYNSPSTFSHTSAMPSPLQYLPATVYAPPSKKGKGKLAVKGDADVAQASLPPSSSAETARAGGLGIRGTATTFFDSLSPEKQRWFDDSKYTSATAKKEGSARGGGLGARGKAPTFFDSLSPEEQTMFDNSKYTSTTANEGRAHGGGLGSGGRAPTVFDRLSPENQARFGEIKRTKPDQPVYELPANDTAAKTTGPQNKAPAPASVSRDDVPRDKLDMVLDMLSKRNSEMEELREELRANQARIDQRLSAFENPSRASASSPSPVVYGQEDVDAWARRVPTDVAHDFYRSAVKLVEDGDAAGTSQDAGTGAQQSEAGGEGGSGGGADGESETIRELRETNRKLIEMVAGFAGKIEALEGRLTGGSGSG